MDVPETSRRGFLAGLGALVIAVPLVGRLTPAHAAADTPVELHAFVGIAGDGQVTVAIPSAEMGQGANTGLAQLVAEELDCDWNDVRVVTGYGKAHQIGLGLGIKMQLTGGSMSVVVWKEPMQLAGAASRDVLIRAAAADWGVAPSECRTERGTVHGPSGQTATYGALAPAAAKLKPPRKPALKARADRRLVGKPIPRVDLRDKVTGAAEFGADIRVEGMLRACTVACPVFGGKVVAVDSKAAKAIAGVREVLVFDDFVAVVADTWWPAKQGVGALKIEWDLGPNADLDSGTISATLRSGLLEPKGHVGRKAGKATKQLEAGEVLEAVYEVPYVDHAPMEPLNTTVRIDGDRLEIWSGCQAQTQAAKSAAKIAGVPYKNVVFHTPLLGGGFGRRGSIDFVEQAVHIATRIDAPVQLMWTREEGIRHGYYRPAMAARMRATLGSDGVPDALHVRICGDNVLHNYLPKVLWGLSTVTNFCMEGLLDHMPYEVEHLLVDWVHRDIPVPIGFWRSVGYSHNAFFLESFLDELAHAGGVDPVELRRKLIGDHHPRYRAVLDRAAAEAGWGEPPEGRFQGVALQESFGSIVAEVAEISMDGGLKVHKVTTVVDCGEVINPDLVDAQLMGGTLFGLSEALAGKVQLKDGRVVQSNFHDYPLLRMVQAPDVAVHRIETPGAPVGGIGEVGTPPVAPAVCNAIFAATGQRIRTLPILDQLEVPA